MKINYNNWFYNYNKYIPTNDRGDKKSYNDTSWVSIMKRIKALESAGDDFITQPLGISGTERGFSHLLDLMVKSNYSFNDIDDSLLRSYKQTLQASMSNMTVNSNAVMLHCKSTDSRYVSYDQMSRYYIIDVPFDQLHFGDRDEFIRQKLSKMHTTANDKYISIQEFASKNYADILGFSIIITVNGYFCNDCFIAIDDHGFKFKAIWVDGFADNGKDYLDFIIYKVDTIRTHFVEVPVKFIKNNNHINTVEIYEIDENGNKKPFDRSLYKNGERNKCLIDIYSPEYLRSGRSSVVFGAVTEDLIVISQYHDTISNFNTYAASATCYAIIYELKYFHEVPNVYPATNYFNVIDDRRVYTERNEGVVEYNNFRVVSEADISSSNPPICTPPISLDRESTAMFDTIMNCLNVRSVLYNFENDLDNLGIVLSKSPEELRNTYMTEVSAPLLRIVREMEKQYVYYIKGAILTSRIPQSCIKKYQTAIEEMKALALDTNSNNITTHTSKFDVYSLYKWRDFVYEITYPLIHDSMDVFAEVRHIHERNIYNNSYAPELNFDDSPHRFKRPISEQCFMTFQWDANNRVWRFAAPTINHFKGIGNTFYIDSGLVGDEIFKFFVLYTDTDSPAELEVDPLTLEQAYDFDKFYEEVSRHEGYIKYWNAENKLMKLSKILYGKYDDETAVQVLGKILIGSVSADDIINQYGSELKYDKAGMTSLAYDPVKGYSDYDPLSSDAAPFTINYLFYTMMMIHDNVDNIEALFMRSLVDEKYSRRYIDINITDAVDTGITIPVNYSRYSKAPSNIQAAKSQIPVSVSIFYGAPYVINSKNIVSANYYRYTFNKYENNRHYPLIVEDGLNPERYLMWDRVEDFDSSEIIFTHDIQVVKLCAKYLTYAYTCISNIETNYTKTYDCRYLINEFKTNNDLIHQELFNIRNNYSLQNETSNVLELIMDDNIFLERLDTISNYLQRIDTITYNGKACSIHKCFDDLLEIIRWLCATDETDHMNVDRSLMPRIRNVYKALCRYNKILNIHELKQWWIDFDIDLFNDLYDIYTGTSYADKYLDIYNDLSSYYALAEIQINALDSLFYDNMVDILNTQHFLPIAYYIRGAFTTYIFDMYAIDTITFDNSQAYNSRPYYATATVNAANFKAPLDAALNVYVLTLKVESHSENDAWIIDDMIPICEYCCFDDTPLTTIPITIYDKNNNVIDTSTIDISFAKAGSSVGSEESFEVIPNLSSTGIAFNNDHEDMTIENYQGDDEVISSVHNDMHFEMLFGNKYIQLDHDNEYVLDPVTYEEHVQSILHVPNKLINSLLLRENSHDSNARMFFKAAQVLHLPRDSARVIESVYGKCFLGQTLYLTTDDGLSTFPVKVTAIDHFPARGFVEAEVDTYNAKWFETKDPVVINKYLSETVECSVIDDNMVNFINEYNHSDYKSYALPENTNDTTPESLPGDPIFVSNNEKYVYSRLNYFFHEDIPNRFIDDEKAAWKFIYLGEATGNYGTIPPEPVPPTPGPDPTRYTRVEYIESSGDAALLLAQTYNSNTKMFLDFSLYPQTITIENPTASDFVVLFGASNDPKLNKYDSSDANQYYAWVGMYQTNYRNWYNVFAIQCSNTNAIHSSGHSFWSHTSANPDDRWFILIDHDSMYYDYASEYSRGQASWIEWGVIPEGTPEGELPLAILGMNTGNDITNKIGGKLYEIKVWDGETLIQHLLPCTDETTSKTGMYDLVRNEFYPSATAVDFTPGPTIEWEEEYVSESSSESSEDSTSQIDTIRIGLIDKMRTDVNINEQYPILREEPDDHKVWRLEPIKFEEAINTQLKPMVDEANTMLEGLSQAMKRAKNDYERKKIQIQIDSYKRKRQRYYDRIEQVQNYAKQLECPTTWFNVRSYDTALMYIANGRAVSEPTIIVDKRDVPITDKINVFLYDWKNKLWIDPSTYSFEVVSDDMKIDNKANYITEDVMKTLVITSDGSWLYTDDILVYIAYNKSDLFDEINLHDNTCQVKFKPILSTAKPTNITGYNNIVIRKHFDGHEEYQFTEYNAQDHEFTSDGFYVKRIPQNGVCVGAPVMRVCDMTLTSGNDSYGSDTLDVYIKMPFGTTASVVPYAVPNYRAIIHAAIDDFTPEKVKLICVNNNSQAQFDGSISSVMFEAYTYIDGNDRPQLSIIRSTLNDFVEGDFVCTVLKSNDYKSHGGLITVRMESIIDEVMTENGRWVRIPTESSYYKELPDEFIVVPPNAGSFDPTNAVLRLDNVYNKEILDEISIYNEYDNPFEFYFNDVTNTRYPISNIKMNDPTSRLVIDSEDNPDVKIAKMTYIGVPRYSSVSIPADGIFDVTGYIPTPLSRDRYEFWVNGRQIRNEDIVILSPTTFQLRNLRSLKNFELIELVDDINDNELMKQGTVYMDLDGKTYGSYRLASLSGKAMIDQNIRYLFNTSNHSKLDTYTRSIDNNPNNVDIEEDIMSQLIMDDAGLDMYSELDNKPTLNGVTVYNMSSTDLGLKEIPINDFIEKYDEVWKKESILNPLFMTSHRESYSLNSKLTLHRRSAAALGYPDSIIVYASGFSDKYFTLYISKSSNGKINEIANTVKVIPFISTGIYALIEKEYTGYWLHCTEPNVDPIKI